MKPLIVNSFDITGGAARAAYRLHFGLRYIGCDSTMFVAQKRSTDPMVRELSPSAKFLDRACRRLRREQISRDFGRYSHTRPSGYEIFSDDRTDIGADFACGLPTCDVLHLHWIAGFIDITVLQRVVKPSVPIIWTLHDMNAFTGGCHYDAGCGKYQASCGNCPQLGSTQPDDLSQQIWKRKHAAYNTLSGSRIHLVALSSWIATEARRSSLLGNHPISIIPNGLDTTIFAPRDRHAIRDVLGIASTDQVVMFIADSTDNQRKGLKFLQEALIGLRDRANLVLLTVGQGHATLDQCLRRVHIDRIDDDRLLSLLYSTADLFVVPSLQDNLPNTVLEAMACGTPVVGFDIGGIPDMVRPGITGLLAPVGDKKGLRAAIRSLLDNENLRRSMASHCRRIAVEEYTLERQARRYQELYVELIEQMSHPEPHAVKEHVSFRQSTP